MGLLVAMVTALVLCCLISFLHRSLPVNSELCLTLVTHIDNDGSIYTVNVVGRSPSLGHVWGNTTCELKNYSYTILLLWPNLWMDVTAVLSYFFTFFKLFFLGMLDGSKGRSVRHSSQPGGR